MESVSGSNGGNDSIWFLYCEILLRLVRLTYRLITLTSVHVNTFNGRIYLERPIIVSNSFGIVSFIPVVRTTAVMVLERQLLIFVRYMREIGISFNQRRIIGDGVVILV